MQTAAEQIIAATSSIEIDDIYTEDDQICVDATFCLENGKIQAVSFMWVNEVVVAELLYWNRFREVKAELIIDLGHELTQKDEAEEHGFKALARACGVEL